MQNSQERLQAAMKYAFENKPKTGGFPFLAECLKKAGVERNLWSLPGAQSIYILNDGVVVQQETPLISGMADVPSFDEQALITALRTDQAGNSTFPEFLNASWHAGVISYDIDFSARTVSYYGSRSEKYVESYPAVEIHDLKL